MGPLFADLPLYSVAAMQCMLHDDCMVKLTPCRSDSNDHSFCLPIKLVAASA